MIKGNVQNKIFASIVCFVFSIVFLVLPYLPAIKAIDRVNDEFNTQEYTGTLNSVVTEGSEYLFTVNEYECSFCVNKDAIISDNFMREMQEGCTIYFRIDADVSEDDLQNPNTVRVGVSALRTGKTELVTLDSTNSTIQNYSKITNTACLVISAVLFCLGVFGIFVTIRQVKQNKQNQGNQQNQQDDIFDL